jgi:hypothetical protein
MRMPNWPPRIAGGGMPAHDARLDQAGGWPAAMRMRNTWAMRPWQPGMAQLAADAAKQSSRVNGWAMLADHGARQQTWYQGNVPASGRWMPIPVGFLNSPRVKQAILNAPQIGTYNQDMQRAAALQAGLAAVVRQASGQSQ